MKNRRSLFHFPLFLDSLKQLRLMGGIYLLICIVFSVLPVILISPGSASAGSTQITITSYNYVLYGYIFIAPVTLIHQVFGYLTKRSHSDFYHSLPLTRIALFLTRLSAVLFILFVTIVLSLLTSFVAYALSGVSVNWVCFPQLLLFFSVCALLLSAVALLGLSVTGTHFAAFVVSCLLLFLPRFLSAMISIIVLNKAPIVEIRELGWLFNASYNLPVALLMPVLSLGEAYTFVGRYSDLIVSGKGLLYTFLLSVIYICAGMVLHRRRKSETAGLSAPSGLLQHIIRCALALPLFTVLGVLAVLGEFSEEPFWTGVLIALAFLVYFIYELITTKKWRNLLPALYVLPVVLVLGFGIPALGTAVAKNALSRVPEPSEIVSVNLHVNASGYSAEEDYYGMLLQKQEYSDAALNKLLLKGLEQGIAHCKAAEKGHSPYSGCSTTTVRFNLKGGKTLTRQIYLNTEDYERLGEIEASHDFYRAVLSETPDPALVSSVSCGCFGDSSDFTMLDLYETFREEYDALPFAEKQQVIVETRETASSNEPTELAFNSDTLLWVSGSIGYDTFSAAYRITSLTPKTLSLFIQQTNAMYFEQTNSSLSAIREKIAAYDESALYLTLYGTVTLYDSANSAYETFQLSDLDNTDIQKVDKLLSLLEAGTPTFDWNASPVYLKDYGFDLQESMTGDGEWVSGEGCLQLLPQEAQKELRALLAEAQPDN